MANETPSSKQPKVTVTPIWHGLAAIHRQPNGKKRLRLRWMRLGGIAAVLTLVLWMMSALALYFWFKLNRGFQDEQFSDMLFLWLPSHYEAHNHKLSEYFLNMGDLHLKNKRIEEAFRAYQLGVEKAQATYETPESLHGREMLADFYYIYFRNELDQSLKVLEDGLPYAVTTDRKYVDNYLLRLQQGHFPDKMIEVCQKYLDGPDAAKCLPDVRMLFALNLAEVYIDQGNFDSADATINRFHLDQTLEGAMLVSRLLWEHDRLREATDYLEKAQARFGNNEYIFGLLSRYYRDLGDLDKAEEYIVKRELMDPSNAMPRIEMLYILKKTGDPTVPDKINSLVEQFHSDASTMTVLAKYAVDEGNPDLANRLYKNAQAQTDAQIKAGQQPTFDVASYALVVAQAYLAKNDYQDALNFLDDVDEEKPHWLEPNRTQFDSLRALADYGLGRPDLTTMYLNKLIKADNTRPDTLVAVANQFLNHNATEVAQGLFQAAYHLDPHNQAALAQLITTDLQLGNSDNMNTNITKLLQTRRPPLEPLYDAETELGSDRFLFVPDRDHLLAELNLYIQSAIKNQQPGSPN